MDSHVEYSIYNTRVCIDIFMTGGDVPRKILLNAIVYMGMHLDIDIDIDIST